MRSIWTVAGLAALLSVSACATTSAKHAPDRVVLVNKDELQTFEREGCSAPNTKAGAANFLCVLGWRPMVVRDEGTLPIEAYQLFWGETAKLPVFVRLDRYKDGSGAVWVTSYPTKDNGEIRTQAEINTRSATEMAPFFNRIDVSRYWTFAGDEQGSRSVDKAACDQSAFWVLEGRRAGDHRAISARGCGAGLWVVDLAEDLVRLAQARIPRLSDTTPR